MDKCSRCGSSISPTAKFCPNCGQKIGEENRNMDANKRTAEKKKSPLRLVAIILAAIVVGLAAFLIIVNLGTCNHEWQEATCTEPRTCTKCGESEGNALGHDWLEASCTAPKTCSRCGITEGEPLGHDWQDATCTKPEVCAICGEEQGEPLGHDWQDATCVLPQICKVCGEKTGEALGHDIAEWEIVSEATCAEAGTRMGVCLRCGEEISEEIPKLDHTPGEWIITESATSTSEGRREIQCTVCGETLETETYELSEEEKIAAFKSECETYSYETIARNPDNYVMEQVRFRGEVIQVIEDGDDYTLRINVTKGDYGFWSDTIYVEYTKNDSSEPRILEDDIVTIYGYCMGTVTYETIFGASVTIPAVLALYVDIE